MINIVMKISLCFVIVSSTANYKSCNLSSARRMHSRYLLQIVRDIFYSRLRRYLPRIVISAIFGHSQFHISTIYGPNQRPVCQRLVHHFYLRPDTCIYCYSVCFLIVLRAAFPCRRRLLRGIIVIYWVRVQLRQSVIDYIKISKRGREWKWLFS